MRACRPFLTPAAPTAPARPRKATTANWNLAIAGAGTFVYPTPAGDGAVSTSADGSVGIAGSAWQPGTGRSRGQGGQDDHLARRTLKRLLDVRA